MGKRRTNKDALKLSLGGFRVIHYFNEAREISTDDPIDIPRLAAVLRKGRGAVKWVRKLKPGKRLEKDLDFYDHYFKDLLKKIVGREP
jgi:hypothetical protein